MGRYLTRALVVAALLGASALLSGQSKSIKPSSRTEGPNGEQLPASQVNLYGKIRDVPAFMKACQKTTGTILASGERQDKAVHVLGKLDKIEDGAWWVLSKEGGHGGWTEPVRIDLSEVEGRDSEDFSRFQPGHIVSVYGIAADDHVRGWLAQFAPPGVTWTVRLRDPGPIAGGSYTRYVVDCTLKNTGKQVMNNVRFAVRLYQHASPNDEVNTYDIPTLRPGQTVRFIIPFDWYNYQFVAGTSRPQVAGAKIISYDL